LQPPDRGDVRRGRGISSMEQVTKEREYDNYVGDILGEDVDAGEGRQFPEADMILQDSVANLPEGGADEDSMADILTP